MYNSLSIYSALHVRRHISRLDRTHIGTRSMEVRARKQAGEDICLFCVSANLGTWTTIWHVC